MLGKLLSWIRPNRRPCSVRELFLVRSNTHQLFGYAGEREEPDRQHFVSRLAKLQSSMNESFAGGDSTNESTLEQFEVGEQAVWLIHGPMAYLVVVIEGGGKPPGSLRARLVVCLEEVHSERRTAAGEDRQELDDINGLLEQCLADVNAMCSMRKEGILRH